MKEKHDVIRAPDVDFDRFRTLFEEDPNAAEVLRTKTIEEFISQVPPERQERLRGLQWQVDQVRGLSKNPMDACIKISDMMWDSVMETDGLLEQLIKLQNVLAKSMNTEDSSLKQESESAPQPCADILKFPKERS